MDFISRNEAAEMVGVSPQTISYLAKKGAFVTKKKSTSLVIDRASFLKFKEEHYKEISAVEGAYNEYIKEREQLTERLRKENDILRKEVYIARGMRTLYEQGLFKATYEYICKKRGIYGREYNATLMALDGMTMGAIAERMGLSTERVCQIVRKHIRVIKESNSLVEAQDERIRVLEERCKKQHAHIKTLSQKVKADVDSAEVKLRARCADISLWECLSVRSINCLRSENIITLEDLLSVPDERHILKIRNMGKKSYCEVKETFERINKSMFNNQLSWGMFYHE